MKPINRPASFILGFTAGGVVTFGALFLLFWPQIKNLTERTKKLELDSVACQMTLAQEKKIEKTEESMYQGAMSNAVVITEPSPDPTSEFLGSLLGAFLGHADAAKDLLSHMNSSGMQPRFFINTANNQVATYNVARPAFFYYYYPPTKQWLGPMAIPDVQTLTANPEE